MLGNFLAVFTHVFDTNMLVSKTQVKTREKNNVRKKKTASETTHSVMSHLATLRNKTPLGYTYLPIGMQKHREHRAHINTDKKSQIGNRYN